MSEKIDINDAADYAGIDPDEAAKVLCFLVDNGWLFTSHVEQNPFDLARA